MVNTMICWGSLSMADSLPRPTICSLVTISIVASSLSKQFAYSCATKSSTLRTFSCCAATTNVLKSTVSMASMTSANADTRSDSGEFSVMSSIVCPLQLWSMRRSSACTAVWAPNSRTWIKLRTSWDQQMFPILASSAICYGQTPNAASKPTATTIEESASLLERMWSESLTRSMISIWFAGRTR